MGPRRCLPTNGRCAFRLLALLGAAYASPTLVRQLSPLDLAVNDDAHMLPAASHDDLSQRLKRFKLRTGFTVSLLTVPYLEEASSVALSIGDPTGGGIALRAVRETGGFGVAVTDEAILETGRLLAANGLVVEPSSAASVCGALQALRDRPELRDRTIVCLVTSSGLKWLDAYGTASAEGALRLATADEARRAVEDFVAA